MDGVKTDKQPKTANDKLQSLFALHSGLSSLRSMLEHLSTHQIHELLENELTKRESAKLCTSITFSLATLLFVALNARGIDVQNHPVSKDIERIKSVVKKLTDSEPNDTQDSQKAKRMRVDLHAASRFVQHHLAN